MDIATVRNGLISQLQVDPDVITKFGASKVDYGLGKKLTEDMFPQSIRIKQRGRGTTEDNAEEFAETGDGNSYVWCRYPFYIVVIFQLSDDEDEKDAEDYESEYDRIVRKALADCTLNNVVTTCEFGRSFLRTHAEDEKVRFVVIEATAITLERADTR